MSKLEQSYSISSETPRTEVAKPEEKKQFRWRITDHHSRPEIYNWTFNLSISVFGVLGSASGYDQVCIPGTVAQKASLKSFGFNDATKTNRHLVQTN